MKTKFIFAAVLIAFSFTTVRAAAAMDEKQFQKSMKEVGRLAKGFKDNAQAKNAAAVEKDSARVAEIYKEMAAFWTARKMDDAAKWSGESSAAATATATSAKAGDWEKVKTSWNAVNKNCKSCHEAHREKLPDGGYKIK